MSYGEFSRNGDIKPPINEEVVSTLAQGIEVARQNRTIPKAELTTLLQNKESQRIVLYIPKQWLPTEKDIDYKAAYTDAWWSTLSQPDQRADFVDGDIGDLHSGENRPLVVKAAHLSPWLLDRGLISKADVHTIYSGTNSAIVRASFDDIRSPNHSPFLSTRPLTTERLQWLETNTQDTLIRSASLNVESFDEVQDLQRSTDTFNTQVALRSVARLARKGVVYDGDMQWMERQLHHEDVRVRNKAVTTYRHLFHAAVLPQEVLSEVGVVIPKLSGALSENLQELTQQFIAMVEKIQVHPILSEMLYPIIIAGGSQLKGYAEEGLSDVDTTVIVRPGVYNKEALRSGLQEIFGTDTPAEFWLENTSRGLRIQSTDKGTDNGWSHALYNTVWVGNGEQIDTIRQQLAQAYEDDALRGIALRRLEQDALQYRLMHKGYERHYAVQADDYPISKGGQDLHSTFWEPGYRVLATQLFAEKVRLPKI